MELGFRVEMEISGRASPIDIMWSWEVSCVLGFSLELVVLNLASIEGEVVLLRDLLENTGLLPAVKRRRCN